MPAVHVRITGRVQGVGFRWFVQERALELGVAGWVRNTIEGDVELAARGDAAQLDSLLGAVSRGPAGARVDRVDRLATPPDAEYPNPFRIHT